MFQIPGKFQIKLQEILQTENIWYIEPHSTMTAIEPFFFCLKLCLLRLRIGHIWPQAR